jgi:hypothetical protein
MRLVRTSQVERPSSDRARPRRLNGSNALVDKQSWLLPRDFHHPSLRAKKYDESRLTIWPI